MRGSRYPRFGLLALGLVGLGLAGCFLFPQAVHYQSLLVPAAQEAGADSGEYAVLESGAISYELSGLRLEVKPLTDGELNALLPDESQKGRYSTNPYTYGNWVDPRLGHTPNRFAVFEVKIYNRTFPKVMMNPLEATLQTDRGQFLRAYGISSASAQDNFENYYRSRRGQSGNEFYRFELRMGIVRSHNYEQDQPIFKGENYGGFIVFDPVHPETRQAALTLNNFVLRFGAFDRPVESRNLRFAFSHQLERRLVQQDTSGGAGAERLLVAEEGPSRLLGNLPGDRTRNPSAIQAVVRQRLGAINRCFAAEFDKGEASQGRVVVSFVVEVGGAVSAARIDESTVGSEAVEQCMEREILGWAFRPIDLQSRQTGTAGSGGAAAETGGAAAGSRPSAAAEQAPLPVSVTYPFIFSVGEP